MAMNPPCQGLTDCPTRRSMPCSTEKPLPALSLGVGGWSLLESELVEQVMENPGGSNLRSPRFSHAHYLHLNC